MSPGRFPDLGDLRITACSAAPRSFSQLGHVLLRLWTPRHPPCTLCSLTTLFVFAVLICTDVAVRADLELRLGALLLSVHRGRHFIPDSPRFQRARALPPIGCAVRQCTALFASLLPAPTPRLLELTVRLLHGDTALTRVEATGLEPTTPWLQTRCSTS